MSRESEPMRIVIAMSGGVDSSVAAALLKEAGHEVIGLSMQLYDQSGGVQSFGSCCTLDDLQDARRVASALGIPHYVVNLERQFGESVVANFVSEYVAGRTPLPCAHCNTDLKFAELVTRALGLGAEAVATGHYARVDRPHPGGAWRLRRGLDPAKDQSYFLFGLTQDQLGRAMFPLGAMTKDRVRDLARDLGLIVADKRDSQEICFVPGGDYASVVARRAPGAARPGRIVDAAGRELGRHGGIHRFTVGQRKGLGIASGEPLYVIGVRGERAEVVVGSKGELERQDLLATGVNWIAGRPPSSPRRLDVQIRSRHRPAAAIVEAAGSDGATVAFDEPQLAITPGQAAVFYDGDELVGGGWIRTEN